MTNTHSQYNNCMEYSQHIFVTQCLKQQNSRSVLKFKYLVKQIYIIKLVLWNIVEQTLV